MTEAANTVEGADLAPEPADPFWQDGDERQCSACSKTRPHTIRRINLPGQPVLCDYDHDERTRK